MCDIQIGSLVEVPSPKEGDFWQHGFVGSVVDIKGNLVTVEDMDGDCWDVDRHRVFGFFPADE